MFSAAGEIVFKNTNTLVLHQNGNSWKMQERILHLEEYCDTMIRRLPAACNLQGGCQTHLHCLSLSESEDDS